MSLSEAQMPKHFVSLSPQRFDCWMHCEEDTVIDLISEHTLISGHPPHFLLVEIIARARRDLRVLAVLLCCIMQSVFDAN